MRATRHANVTIRVMTVIIVTMLPLLGNKYDLASAIYGSFQIVGENRQAQLIFTVDECKRLEFEITTDSRVVRHRT